MDGFEETNAVVQPGLLPVTKETPIRSCPFLSTLETRPGHQRAVVPHLLQESFERRRRGGKQPTHPWK